MVYHVVCGASYYTPGLCYQPPYKNWDPNTNFTPPVIAETTLQQTFTPVCSPVKSVRVWAAPARFAGNQTTNLAVKDSVSGQILETQTVKNENVILETPGFVGNPSNRPGWLEIPTTALDQVQGKKLTLELTSNGTDPGQALLFSITNRHEYASGEFTINGNVMNYDLLFAYGCSVK
jgi:hypothetical protein